MRWLLPSLLYLSFFASLAWAVENPQSGSVGVSLTVPDRGRPDIPLLISPANNATINTAAPNFIFSPSLGDRPVSHYQLWLDGVKNTDHIPQSFAAISAQALTALSEGTHTWMIKAIATNGSDRDSAIWTFTVDLTAPLILVETVAGQDANLSSLDLARWLSEVRFTTSQAYPAITGQSEAGAQITVNFSGNGGSQTIAAEVGLDRLFAVKPQPALTPGRYKVSVAGSDPAGNNTSLPAFYLDITAPTGQIVIPLPSPLPDVTITLPKVIPPAAAELPAIWPLFPAPGCRCPWWPWILILLLLFYILYLKSKLKHLNRSKDNNYNRAASQSSTSRKNSDLASSAGQSGGSNDLGKPGSASQSLK